MGQYCMEKYETVANNFNKNDIYVRFQTTIKW